MGEAEMNRDLLACVGVLLLVAASGCAMSDNSLDCTYGAHGGKWQRADPCCGRVGSLFDSAGTRVVHQQTTISPAQQPDDGPQSVLAPEVDESLESASPDTDEHSLPPLSLDEMSPDDESERASPIDLETETPEAKPADLAPLELGPVDETMESESGGEGAPLELPEAEEMDSVDELPDFLDELGIKREPSEPLKPLESGALAPLGPATNTTP
jgi:hypothetical protein